MADKKRPTGDYEVGYCRPPKSGQIKKGERRNPKGRPKKSKQEPIDIAAVLKEPVTVKNQGVCTTMGPFEVGVRQIARKAIKEKNLNAIIEFLGLCERYHVIRPPPVDEGGGIVVAPKGVDFTEWLEASTEWVPLSQIEEDHDTLN